MALTKEQKEQRDYKKYLKDLVEATETFLASLDTVMKEPSTPEKGREIAALSNRLDYAKDMAKHFGLGIPFKNNKLNPKKKAEGR